MKYFLAFVIGGLIVWAVMSHHKADPSPVVQADHPERMPTLEEQARCAKQAHEEFKREGWTLDGFTGYTNHYNPKLGKCLFEVSTSSMVGKFPSVTIRVGDAFEATVVAKYDWMNSQGKQFYEVPPSDCTVDDATCKSLDEFNSLVFNKYGLDAVK